VTDAVILAAGNGDRFMVPAQHSKLLHPVLGQPLILRTLRAAREAGLATVTIVLGYAAEAVRAVVEAHAPAGLALRFVYNPEWHLENGVSALRARESCDADRFALMMADHVFEPRMLSALVQHIPAKNECLLGIDRRVVDPALLAEATRVQMEGDQIVAIGKSLSSYDAVDTGLFVFTPAIFESLDAAIAAGNTTLSAGVQRLADRRLICGLDIGPSRWCDVDTVADVKAAEAVLAGARERV
jgi:choline kinase